MPIAITEEQRALAGSVRDWARSARPVDTVRAQETGGDATALPAGLAALGLFGVAVPERFGGAGGDVVDLASGLAEAAAALAPGPVLGTLLGGLLLSSVADSAVVKELLPAVAEGTERLAVALGEDGPVLDAHPAAWLLVPRGDGHLLLPPGASSVSVEPVRPFDFSRPIARVRLLDADAGTPLAGLAPVAELAATLAAAEAAGVAGWCLRTAVEYARVREQFGHPIGSFQAVKHLCAEMLCRAEAAAALGWDAARAVGEPGHSLAAATAAAVALDAAVDNAKDCVQILGGLGFTWEHDAHLYLRRAVALRQWLGGSGRWRRRAAELALAGTRRTLAVDAVAVDVGGLGAVVAEIAALPEDERRVRLADTGLLAPHWPQPYGLGAAAGTQLGIDAALTAAGVRRPDLVIGAWAIPTILEHGSAAQRDRFAGPTLRGELIWCQLFSEPEAGSDLASLRTVACRVDGGWRLTGQKVWTSLAREADWGICLARTNPAVPKHQGITYFLVDMRASGIDPRPLREITGDAVFNEVFLDEVFVPDDQVVGEVDGGWRLARTTLANERVALGSGSAVGEGVENLLAGLTEVPDVELERLGEVIAQGSACSVLELRATLRRLAGQSPGAESSVRKLLGVRHRQDVAELALELGDTGAARHEFLLTRCLSIAGGTTQVLLTLAAERLLDLPRR
ncbi:acyl-CoA dehydrogenase [Amycolatopsis sp. H20-H5]|uniref:acyl-CoA dehydrogenase n=1 Tax=Amycolatopsis sp. H20-H5 TaxID=3046309 RepID=UPI002DBC3991|nr:acyl-CoA dehydrogenase [Amycolatopsis sp. H20-H5]MEC3977120.1 acyl-CoA dehydrogenase [Amycolatopsis sp. H20-H5]